MSFSEPQEHFGVYGAWLQDGRLVTVEKARGPYTGWLDLPGGTPAAGETREQTLACELDEECAAAVRSVLEWHPFEFRVDLATGARSTSVTAGSSRSSTCRGRCDRSRTKRMSRGSCCSNSDPFARPPRRSASPGGSSRARCRHRRGWAGRAAGSSPDRSDAVATSRPRR
ncbi:NUDIX domain-containing protein [Schumannella soli]|uniref:NUDIX domain-containing protein n=1 Tax=Schumannella soli TaxID=2590779 RepID=UPI0034E23CEA